MKTKIAVAVILILTSLAALSRAEERREFVTSVGNETLSKCDIVVYGFLRDTRLIGSQTTYIISVKETLYGVYRESTLVFVSTETNLVKKNDGNFIAAFKSSRSTRLQFVGKTLVIEDLEDAMLEVFREYVRIESIDNPYLAIEQLKSLIFRNLGSGEYWLRENAGWEFRGLAERSPRSFTRDDFLRSITEAKELPRSRAKSFVLAGIDKLLAYKFEEDSWNDLADTDPQMRETATLILTFAADSGVGSFDTLDLARVRLIALAEEDEDVKKSLGELHRAIADRLERS